MRSNGIVAWLLFSAAVALAQVSHEPASVSGVVVNSITGAPVPRAHVTFDLDAEEDRTYGAMTTADGRFSISGMTPGSYAVTMERIGFSMPTGADAPENVALRPGGGNGDLRLKLIPAGAITGRVTNAEGDPVEGVQVQAQVHASARDNDVDSTTDAKGRFRIGGLAPGRYRVKAMPEKRGTPAELRTDGSVDVQDAPTYYPGSPAFRQGAQVDVTAGSETSGVEIRLARVPIVAVGGKVEGAPTGSLVLVSVNQIDGDNRGTTPIVRMDGTFRIWRLYPGKYEIGAWWQAPGDRTFRAAPVDVEVAGSNIDKLNLRLVPPLDIDGRVEFEDDAAKPRRAIVAQLTLTDAHARGGTTGVAYAVDIAADGSFHLAQVPAGRYRVGLSWNHVYVASMQLGAAAISGSSLDLTGDAGETGLSVRVSSATGSIAGNVVDDRGPAAGARVGLVFDGEGAGSPPVFATVGSGGMYSFDGVAPGRYKLVAFMEADDDWVVQSGRLYDYEELMEVVEVYPADKLSHDLKLRTLDDK